MHIEEAFVAYLLARPGLSALIDCRLYPDETPQKVDIKTQPTIVYLAISDSKLHTHDGQSLNEDPIYQFTTYAGTRAAAIATANELKLALCDYKGTLNGVKVQYITLINELPSMEKTPDGTLKIYTVSLEFQINFERS